MSKNTAIGIDLGTTFSVVSVWENNAPVIIANKGKRLTPSVVGYTSKDGTPLVGQSAVNQQGRNAKNTIYSAKRLVGRKFDDQAIQADINHWPFTVVEDKEKECCQIKLEWEQLIRPEAVSAEVLRSLKMAAEDYLGTSVSSAVITVPAYFNDAQRQATIYAGEIAGLKVERIINEPTAAAIAYGVTKGIKDKTNLLVYDLGGGTFDVTILTIQEGAYDVIATTGDTHLGGEDFDQKLMDYILEECKKLNPESVENLEKHKRSAQYKHDIRMICQAAKIALSTDYTFPAYFEKLDFSIEISRAKFEFLCQSLFDKTIQLVESVMKGANMRKKDIDQILLVGGSTYIPKIRTMLQSFFEKELIKSINADEAVAIGAAIQAATLATETKEKTGTKLDFTLMDVTAHDLGVEVRGEEMSVIIPAQTPIPTCAFSQSYTPQSIGQRSIQIKIYQGPEKQTKYNKYIEKIDIPDIPPIMPVFDVEFRLNINGILAVNVLCRDNDKVTKREFDMKKVGGFSENEKSIARATNAAHERRYRQDTDMQQLINEMEGLISNSNSMSQEKVNQNKQFLENMKKSTASDENIKALREKITEIKDPRWFKSPLNL